ncbi:hypothetical protein [Bordetella petrii]|nr:hypothetical protein [Bordetella petrii]MBO1112335.1 hypothetical protein [Bordetella petrii]
MRDSFFESRRAGEMPHGRHMVDEAGGDVNKKSILLIQIDYSSRALQYAA